MAISLHPRALSGLGSAYNLCKQGINEFSVLHYLSWRVTEVTAKAANVTVGLW